MSKITYHGLADNPDLTESQYERCRDILASVGSLIENSKDYIFKHGLQEELFIAGNQWADLDCSALRRDSYLEVNYMRLRCNFNGFDPLVLMHTTDPGYAEKVRGTWGEAANAYGLPENIRDLLHADMDPVAAMTPVVNDWVEHAMSVPPNFRVNPPPILGAVGARLGPYLIELYSPVLQSRMNAMIHGGLIEHLAATIEREGRATMVEIGAGYGAQALTLKSLFGDALQYVIVDLPTSIFASSLYLSVASGFRGCWIARPNGRIPDGFSFAFVANYLLPEYMAQIGPVHAAINTMSLGEMSPEQVEYYGMMLSSILGEHGLFYDENCAVFSNHVNIVDILKKNFYVCRELRAGSGPIFRHGCHRIWSNRV